MSHRQLGRHQRVCPELRRHQRGRNQLGHRRFGHPQGGFALLVVMWTVGFLALLGTQIVAAGRADTQLANNLKQEAMLRAAADGAVADVMFHLLAAKDLRFRADGLIREVRIGQTRCLVRVESESDRINLNTASGILLRALIAQMGVAPALADRISMAILDWRTSGRNARVNGAKAAEYQAAGLAYGPPGTPFQGVDELADVLGMTPDLYERLAPHLTVLTDGDPDLSTRDPVVAQALTDAAGVADSLNAASQVADEVFRITVIAQGPGAARYGAVVVTSADFQSASPRINILLREPFNPAKSNIFTARNIR